MNSIVAVFAMAILLPSIIVWGVLSIRRDIKWQSSRNARLHARLAEGTGRFTKGRLLLNPHEPRWLGPDGEMSLAGFRLVQVVEPNIALRLRVFSSCFVIEAPDGARWRLFIAGGAQPMLEDVFGHIS